MDFRLRLLIEAVDFALLFLKSIVLVLQRLKLCFPVLKFLSEFADGVGPLRVAHSLRSEKVFEFLDSLLKFLDILFLLGDLDILVHDFGFQFMDS